MAKSDFRVALVFSVTCTRMLSAKFEKLDRYQKLTGQLDGTFRIVGLVDRTGAQVSVEFSAPNYAPITAFPDTVTPSMVSAIPAVSRA